MSVQVRDKNEIHCSVEGHLWWQKGIIYQVYPRSFADADGDGTGDLKGITERLDYLVWLGIDALWISPFFLSPMADFGYDIADYCAVDPLFGSLGDFDELLQEAHARNIRVILDFVPNHTSDQHPWFIESRSSRDNPKRNWYMWEDPKADGSPPNNWLSQFGGSAWEFDEATGQYYHHGFLKEQPDLNWRNPEVEEAMLNVLRFWLARGVDGFRVDVLWHIIKDDQLRDNPPNPYYNEATQPTYDAVQPVYSTDRPEVHEVIQRMRRVIESYGREKLFIGEIYLPTERLMAYYGADADGTHMPYNFQLSLVPWRSDVIMQCISEYLSRLPRWGWPNWVLGNHDRPRIASRVEAHQVRGAQLLLLTLQGTPTMYFGDEIGMVNVPVAPHEVQDPYEKREPNKGNGRDPQRSPMQWSAGPGAGFTTAERSWLPLGDYQQCNVEAQQADPNSLLMMVKNLIDMRRTHPALRVGVQNALPAMGSFVAFSRDCAGDCVYVIINFADHPAAYSLPPGFMECVFSTCGSRAGEHVAGKMELAGGEGVILELQAGSAAAVRGG